MKPSFLFIILFCIAISSFGQRSFKEAEKKFETKEYFAAIDLYKQAYKDCDKGKKPECLWKIAEGYRLIGDVKQARIMYEKAIAANCKEASQAKIYLADSTQMYAYVRIPPAKVVKVIPDTVNTAEKDTNVAIIPVPGRPLSPEETKELYSLLYPTLRIYKNFLMDLSYYKYQCVTIINKQGEKVVEVNAFCMSKSIMARWSKIWKEDLNTVDDGGNCFFHFFINLKEKTCTGFQTNGPG